MLRKILLIPQDIWKQHIALNTSPVTEGKFPEGPKKEGKNTQRSIGLLYVISKKKKNVIIKATFDTSHTQKEL